MRGTGILTAAALAVCLLAPAPAPAQTTDGPPPLPPAEVQFWYAEGQNQRGPVTLDQMRELVATGRVTRTTLVWRKGLANWSAAGEVEDMAVLFVPTDGPPPPPSNDWARFMVGTWYMEQQIQQIQAETYGTYNSDGTFTAATSYYGNDNLNPGQRILISTNQVEGTWKTTAMTGEKFQLILTYTRASDPAFKLPTTPVSNMLERTGPNSVFNATGKFQARRVQ